jgi:hypothetical protein
MNVLNRSAITVYGTEKFLEWIKEQHPNLHRWTLKDLNNHPNVYLVDEEDQNCWGDCFIENFETIFRNEVGEYVYDEVEWPEVITVDLFRAWFTFQYSELAYDLSKDDLEIDDVWQNT